MKRVVVSEPVLVTLHWSACHDPDFLFFLFEKLFNNVLCESKFSALYCKLTRALNLSEFYPNHTTQLISKEFFHIRG